MREYYPMTNTISASINLGFRKTVETMLKLNGVDVNARDDDGRTLLGACVLSAAQSQSRNCARNQLEIGRLLVARGARADGLLGNERLLQSPLVMPITSLNVAGTDDMYAWYDLLIGAGADPDASSMVLVDGFMCRIVAGVTEAGSYKKWVRRPHMKLLGLRSLYARGRARLARAPRRRLRCYGAARQDHAIEFLVKLGDNGIVWNILSFWKEA